MMKPAALAMLILLAACGKQGELMHPTPPGTAPQKKPPASEPLPSKLLKLPTQAAPARIDDPLTKSQDRRDDRFNLPPPG